MSCIHTISFLWGVPKREYADISGNADKDRGLDQLETTPSNSSRHVAIFRSIWSFTLCKVCIRIPANHATSARNSFRCAPEIHGRIPCGETQRQVLGRIVHRPNHRASAYEKYGGLTRGKGMTENQRFVWVLSMPVCASINETMQKV